jgi:hypothetical protein
MFEYQAELAEGAGLAGMNVAWLRTELNMVESRTPSSTERTCYVGPAR